MQYTSSNIYWVLPLCLGLCPGVGIAWEMHTPGRLAAGNMATRNGGRSSFCVLGLLFILHRFIMGSLNSTLVALPQSLLIQSLQSVRGTKPVSTNFQSSVVKVTMVVHRIYTEGTRRQMNWGGQREKGSWGQSVRAKSRIINRNSYRKEK